MLLLKFPYHLPISNPLILLSQIAIVSALPKPAGDELPGGIGRGPVQAPPLSSTICPNILGALCVYEMPNGELEVFPPGATVILPPAGADSTPNANPAAPVTVPANPPTVPISSFTTLTTSAVQLATIAVTHPATGSAITSLETTGIVSVLPFPTSIIGASSSLSLVDPATIPYVQPTLSAPATTISLDNVFQAIGTDAPPAAISSRGDHPVPRLGIQPQQQRLQTNKFYSNLYLGSQTGAAFTFPYSISWAKGTGAVGSWGLAVSHTEASQWATGPARPGIDAGQWEYYANPVGLRSIILSAVELGSLTTLTTDSLEGLSVNANLLISPGGRTVITFPLVQGIAFFTGVYTNATPLIQSGLGFKSVLFVGTTAGGATYKYSALLSTGITWLIYVTPSSPSYEANTFTLVNQNLIGPSAFSGSIQVAKVPTNPSSDVQTIYDKSAGVYAVAATVSGNVDGGSGSYMFSWTKAGRLTQPLLMFALPHHVSSLSAITNAAVTDLQLQTTVKGVATAILSDSWLLDEPDLPVTMAFAPWSPSQGSIKTVSAEAIAAINAAGISELSQNIAAQTNQGSLYYDGKALAKFAGIIYTLYDIAQNHTLALTGLQLLQNAFNLHVNNQMQKPLVYDTAWGGLVSSASYTDHNSGDDFGNTYYNDHHFHYGYFVYTAAVLAYLDPTYLPTHPTVQPWVNSLIRDFANPVSTDPYFPFSRMFDWYHGHSWAAGLFESFDGKNQESSSEDTMASYALKLWGHATGDTATEARGNLMLAVQARSLQSYYLMTTQNAVQPAQFTGNKAAGILFENKIDHTTFFGAKAGYIEGIHMLPVMPCSALTRTRGFVQEEWDFYGWGGVALEEVTDGFKGVIWADHALVDPAYMYAIFANQTGEFREEYLDGGASLTWYLAWSAALGGSG